LKTAVTLPGVRSPSLFWDRSGPTDDLPFGGSGLEIRTRHSASLRRAAAALAGGMLFGAIWIIELRIDHLMGWWHNRLAGTSNPFSIPNLLFLTAVFTGAMYLLVSWRLARRFARAGGGACFYRRGSSYRDHRQPFVFSNNHAGNDRQILSSSNHAEKL
jgi:hypothetical protein